MACSYEPERKRDGSRRHLREELNKIGAMMDVLGEVSVMDTVTQNEKEMHLLLQRTDGRPLEDVILLVWSYVKQLDILYREVLPKSSLGKFQWFTRRLEAQNRKYGKLHAHILICMRNPELAKEHITSSLQDLIAPSYRALKSVAHHKCVRKKGLGNGRSYCVYGFQ